VTDIADRRVTRTLPRVPHTAGFWLLGVALLAFMIAAAAPSPLYVVYQHRYGFSAATLTVVFAVYALALLLSLVTVGALSDHVGRRPVLAASLLLEAISMVVFMTAGGVGGLIAARILQGLATGAASGAISAALIDFQPADRPRLGALVNSTAPTTGLAVGALASGLLAQYAPAPTTLVFAALAVAFIIVTVVVGLLPETVSRRPGALASLRPRVAVPPRARGQFAAAVPCLVATWAIGGLYLALGPSLAADALHISNHVVGGLVITTLSGAAAAASVLVRDQVPRRTMAGGAATLAVGTGLTLLGLATTSTPAFLFGTAVACA
jgi:MFS family permease